MSGIVAENDIPAEQIYKITFRSSWALDFYNQHAVKITEASNLPDMGAVWVYGTDDDLKKLKESGLDWDRHFTADQFRITRLQAKVFKSFDEEGSTKQYAFNSPARVKNLG